MKPCLLPVPCFIIHAFLLKIKYVKADVLTFYGAQCGGPERPVQEMPMMIKTIKTKTNQISWNNDPSKSPMKIW